MSVMPNSASLEDSSRLPLVSIIIPVSNDCANLKEAIASALSQTYDNIEILVINDAINGTWKAEKIVLSYGDKIRFLSNPHAGAASALNLGISAMRGEYFSWLNPNDIYKPDKISAQMEIIQSSANPDLAVFTSYEAIDSHGQIAGDGKLESSHKRSLKCSLFLENKLYCATLLVSTRLLKQAGGFRDDLEYIHGLDLCARLKNICQFVYLDQTLVMTRLSEEKKGQKNIDEMDSVIAPLIRNLTQEEIEDYFDANPDALQAFFQKYIKNGYMAIPAAILVFLCQYYYQHNQGDKAAEALGIASPDSLAISNLIKAQVSGKPRLMFYNLNWCIGGIGRVLSLLFKQLSKKYEIIFITQIKDPEVKCFHLPEEVVHLQFKTRPGALIPIQLTSLAILTKSEIFIGTANLQPFFLPIYKLLKCFSIPSVMYNHHFYFFPNRAPELRLAGKMRDEAFADASLVVWVNRQDAAIASVKNTNSIAVLNPAVMPDIKKRVHPSEKLVLAVGRFNDAQKRLDLVLNLFKYIYARDNECRLLLVGPIPDGTQPIGFPVNKNVQAILAESGLPDSSYEFAGAQLETSAYYQRASLLVMASEHEGFPMVLVEAGAYGLPVLVYGTPFMDTIITNGQNGYITEICELDKAADLAVNIINNRNGWQRLSAGARELAQRFSLELFVEKWESIIESLLNKRPLNQCNPELRDLFPVLDNNPLLRQILHEYENYGIDEKRLLKDALQKFNCAIRMPKYHLKNTDHLRGKSIILYGAGRVGVDLYHQLSLYQDINIKYWLDKNPDGLKFDYAKIYHPDNLAFTSDDYVVIAVLKENLQREIKKYLISRGICEERIFWEKPELNL